MAKEKSSTDPTKDKKKEKKEKKRSEENGIAKPAKKEKKDKEKKRALENSVAVADANGDVAGTEHAPGDGDMKDANGKVKEEDEDDKKKPMIVGAIVPFANPLCDEKVTKKVLRGVKKAASTKSLKRGVKEVVKALRKSPLSTTSSTPTGIVVLAADISPMDVISHIPVLCEDHSIPYVYVRSRAELGAAGSTKRPTSVVMVGAKAGKGAKAKEDGDEEWEETYKTLVKVVEKEGVKVRV